MWLHQYFQIADISTDSLPDTFTGLKAKYLKITRRDYDPKTSEPAHVSHQIDCCPPDRFQACLAAVGIIMEYYNTRRRHSSLDYV